FGTGNGKFFNPTDVAIDSAGNVYVTDGGLDRVQKFTSSGVYLSQWGTTGSLPGQLSFPAAIAVDASDNLFVTDYNNARIQKFTSAATPTSAIAFPADGGVYNSGGFTDSLTGTASGPEGVVAGVGVRIQRSSDGAYWNGGPSTWTGSSSTFNATAYGSA